jgi:hypothetical protein
MFTENRIKGLDRKAEPDLTTLTLEESLVQAQLELQHQQIEARKGMRLGEDGMQVIVAEKDTHVYAQPKKEDTGKNVVKKGQLVRVAMNSFNSEQDWLPVVLGPATTRYIHRRAVRSIHSDNQL